MVSAFHIEGLESHVCSEHDVRCVIVIEGGPQPALLLSEIDMPLFEFQCDVCGKVSEELCSFRASLEELEGAECLDVDCCGTLHKVVGLPGKAKVWRYDLDHFGTPAHAEARAHQCGVDL